MMRAMATRQALALAATLVAWLGCGSQVMEGPPAGFASCPDAGTPAEAPTPAAPDYWHDVKPILDARCAACHTAEGIAPFPILTYRDAASSALLIQAAVSSRKMPPWPPNDCCQQYRHDRSLSPAEIETILRWIDAGTPEGDPQGAPPSIPVVPPMLSRVDVSLRMPEAFVPVAQVETGELRCFLIEDWPFDTDKLVTGVDVRPGNRAIVQHVIVQTVGAGDLAQLRSRQGLDGRPGFDCRDLPDEIHLGGAIGSWTPGQTPSESPEGVVGVPVPAHSQIMLQVQYDVRNGVTTPDQTEIDFQLADTVKHPVNTMVVANPTLITHGQSFHVLSVSLDTHFLGSSGRIAVHRKGGPWDCLLDIPRWDYHWAGYYELVEPVRVDPGDTLYVECHWDGTAASQKADDMCAGVLLYTDTWP
jgi:hypothetical protein